MTNDVLTIGVDLGGTKVKTALVDTRGQIMSVHTYPTTVEKGPEGVIADILICVKNCLGQVSESDVQAVGIGVAGQVDLNGVVRYAPNLDWHNIALKAKLEEQLNMPVVVVNDVRGYVGRMAIWGWEKRVRSCCVICWHGDWGRHCNRWTSVRGVYQHWR